MFRMLQRHCKYCRAFQVVLTFFWLTSCDTDPMSAAYAGNYYVDPTGNDSNAGTQVAPFLTIQKAVTVAKPGDVVLIKAGTYGAVKIYVGGGLGKSGTAGAPIIFKAFGDGDVLLKNGLWIEGEYLEFQNLKITNPNGHAIFLTGKGQAGSGKIATHHVKFLRCEIFNARDIGVLADYDTYENEFLNCDIHHNGTYWFESQGFYIGGDRYKLIGNTIHDNASTGIQLWSSYNAPGHPSGNIIRDNLIYGNGYTVITDNPNLPERSQYGHGIVIGSSYGGSNDNLIANNLIYANFPNGVSSYSKLGANNKIYNNTIVGNIYGLNLDGEAAGLLIKNNLVFDNNAAAVARWLQKNRPALLNSVNPARHGSGKNLYASGGGTNFDAYVLDNNLWGPATDFVWKGNQYQTFQQYRSASGKEANSILVIDAGLVDLTANYRLTPGSPAIDAGATLPEVTNDFDGKPRPQGPRYDIGAYEFGGSLYAKIDASTAAGAIPLTVNFSGYAVGGAPPYLFAWDFGDNNSSTQQNPSYRFDRAGSYTIKLSVTDANNNKANTSTAIAATNPAAEMPSVTEIKFTAINQTAALTSIETNTWYDLYLVLNDPQGWNDLSYADVWLNHSSDQQGTAANRGGNYFAASKYILSYSLEDSAIWAKEHEGADEWANLSGRLSSYVDDDAGEYRHNGAQKWAKARVRLLSVARPGTWQLNAFVWDRQQHQSAVLTKSVNVVASVAVPTAVLEINRPAAESGEVYRITLVTSQPVVKAPTPLSFVASNGTTTTINLTGSVPGNTFKGELRKSPAIAEGTGQFTLAPGALVNQSGQQSNDIVQGKFLNVDWPPHSPQNVRVQNPPNGAN